MQSVMLTTDSELQPTAGEEIAIMRIEDETADDSVSIMADSSDEITDDLPVMIAEAEAEAEAVSSKQKQKQSLCLKRGRHFWPRITIYSTR
jgi:hypothetical protein